MPTINWRKWWTYLIVLVFLYLLFTQPAVIGHALAHIWDSLSTAFGPMLSDFFSWLVDWISKAHL